MTWNFRIAVCWAVAVSCAVGFGCAETRVQVEADPITGNKYIFLPLRNASRARPVHIQVTVARGASPPFSDFDSELLFVKEGRDSIPETQVHFNIDGQVVTVKAKAEVLLRQQIDGARSAGIVRYGVIVTRQETQYEQVRVRLSPDLLRRLANARVVRGRIGELLLGQPRGDIEFARTTMPFNEFMFAETDGANEFYLQPSLKKFLEALNNDLSPEPEPAAPLPTAHAIKPRVQSEVGSSP